MRRYVKHISEAARWIGIALLFLAVVISIYIAASTGGSWNTFRTELESRGVSTDIRDRLGFNADYYAALSRASSEKKLPDQERAEHTKPYFSAFEAKAADAEKAAQAAELESSWAYFDGEFDADAYLAVYEQAENGQETRELKEIFEYLDAFAAAPAKGKLAKLKPASTEPYFKDAYEAFAAANAEGAENAVEVGTYYEYMMAIRHMAQAYEAEGNTIKDVKAWAADAVTPEAYQEALTAIRAEERVAEDSLSDRVAQAVQSGEGAKAALEAIWAELSGEDPALSEQAFLSAMKALLSDPAFDGSVKSLKERMQAETEARSADSYAAFMDAWSSQLVQEADNRSIVGVVAAFWKVVSGYLWMWIIGAALVIASIVSDKLLARHMLKQLEHGGIQEDPDVLLRVEHLCQYFRSGDHVTKAVDDVSFYVKKGEVFGLVGESGCGKTTTGRTIINLYDPTSGDVYFDGLRISSNRNGLPVLRYTLRRDARARIAELKEDMKEQIRRHPEKADALKAKCAEEIRKVKKTLRERLIHAQNDALESEAQKNKATELYRQQRREQLKREYDRDAAALTGEDLAERKRRYEAELKAAEKDNVMTRMQMIFQDPIASIDPRMTVREIIAEGLRIRGIKDKKIIDQKVYEMLDLVGLVSEHADRYPHEFSGGQRQRIGIARAIALEPELIIADEPISALDVSIQAQVINLLNDLRKRMGLTIIFIAHNLSVVKYFSDRIAVMYFGNIVEMATSEELFAHPLHPYTRSLLSAIPYPDPHYEKQRKRLEYNPARAHDYSVDKPSLQEIEPGHWIRCNQAELAKYREELKK